MHGKGTFSFSIPKGIFTPIVLNPIESAASDNPRNEDPFSIITEIKKGISTSNFEVIEDRELAIKSAIENSEDNVVILVAGKGHENYQEINGVRKHFSDREVAEKYLAAAEQGNR